MKKDVKTINVSYTYDANHTRAHYTFDGIHFMNAGEWTEAVVKAAYGLEAKKDSNTAFDVASDIPEYNASVKSSAATVFNKKLANTFNASLKKFFEKVVSTEFWFVVNIGEELHIYKMNADEFKSFIKEFGFFNERQVIRLAKVSGKMINWLENKVEA